MMTRRTSDTYIIESYPSDEGGPLIPAVGGTGAKLAAAREEMDLTVSDIANSLKLSEEIVITLERNEYEKLYGMAYTTGYVRAYASIVNLNPEELIENDPYLGVVPITDTTPYAYSSDWSSEKNFFSWTTLFVRSALVLTLTGSLILAWSNREMIFEWWDERAKIEKINEIQGTAPDESRSQNPPESGISSNPRLS